MQDGPVTDLAALPNSGLEHGFSKEKAPRMRGISLVIVGIIVVVIWSFWIGLIIALIGLVAFGGFVRGKWY
jgi:hypothetical protein